ncbi:cytochrome b5 reductase 4 [Brachionichthys hirsutus]|uniref:cytochrome b5 reductase 4 n=1 Tax=Brachionichthys hirsutus TaxID=412623 RepID=UPI00360499C2
MLNPASQSFPLPGSQQRVAPSGQSARKKVALKPGHSLLDWIRFSKSGRDLSGLRGRLVEVTQEELQKHATRDDCWTSIRGMVYNLSPYMDYHPGGEEELMKAGGTDGTGLFDQVHRWVNYESMLKECLVGRMATVMKAVIPAQTPTGLLLPDPVPVPDRDGQPRYDWFQTDATVQVVVYAKKKFPSTGCSLVDLESGVLRVELLLEKLSYMIHLRLADSVEDNISVSTAVSVGKTQLTMQKQAKRKWARLGQPLEGHNTLLPKTDRALYYRDCLLVSKTEVNRNTSIFRMRLPRGTVRHLPVGKHVFLKALVHEAEVVRPYTPVEPRLAAAPWDPLRESDIYLLIKVYPDGLFTPYLSSLPVGAHVSVSGPEGAFSLRPLDDITHLYLVAAGTGLTPMLRLVPLALQDIESISKIKLLFFNRREEDILCRRDLDELAATRESFEVEHVLSEPGGGWTGRRGRIDDAVLRDSLCRPAGSKCCVCVCGPAPFTELTVRLLKQQGFGEEELHAFQD